MNWQTHQLIRQQDLPYIPEEKWQQASNHHQSIDRLAQGLESIIRSDDGEIEAFASKDNNFVLGTQWHVEKCDSVADISLLREFSRRLNDQSV